MRLLLSAFLLLMIPGTSHASSPGMVEGPPGCLWDATVIQSEETSIVIRLDRVWASCMAASCPVGDPLDEVTISFAEETEPETQDAAEESVEDVPEIAEMPDTAPAHEYSKDDAIQVWIDRDEDGFMRVGFEQPECTATPIKPPEEMAE